MSHRIPLEALDRPIAFHRIFRRVGGSVNAALFLSQAHYWSQRLPDDREGWFYKSRDEWEEETTLSRYEQEGARKHLVKAGILEEKREGLPARLWFRVNHEVLAEKIVTALLGENPPTGGRETNQPDGGKPTDIHTESTAESTGRESMSADADATDALSSSELFELFWKRYPKGRGSKKASRSQWDRLKVDADLFQKILDGLAAWEKSHEWREPRYIKHCERWLRDEMWKNPPQPAEVSAPPTLRERTSPNHHGIDNFQRKWGIGPYAGAPDDADVIDVEGGPV